MDNIGTAALRMAQQTAAATATSPPSPSKALALPAKRDANGLPVKIDRECDIELARLFEAWIPSDGPRAIVRALADGERAKLDSRAAALREALMPFDGAEVDGVKAAIAGMLSGYRSTRNLGENTVQVTLAVLREFPAWAITEACLRIVRGQASTDRRFAPNDTEIYDTVASIVRDYRDGLNTARALLDAPVMLPPPPRAAPGSGGAQGRPPSGRLASVPPFPGDGNHAKRVAADLAARKARNAARQPEGDHP